MCSFKILVRVAAMWGAWLCLGAVNDSLGQSKGESPQPAIRAGVHLVPHRRAAVDAGERGSANSWRCSTSTAA